MKQLEQWIADTLGLSQGTVEQLLLSALVIFIFYLIRLIAIRLVLFRVKDISKRYRWRKGLTYGTTFLIICFIGRIWLEGLQSLATFIGLFAAGLAVALQDLVLNFAGWLFILWKQPFKVGDRIEIDGKVGDVIDIRTFLFAMMEVGNWVDADQSTGRVIHIPNGRVFKNSLANSHLGLPYVWNEIPVLITFESSWEKAKEILQSIINTNAKDYTEMAKRNLENTSQSLLIVYQKLTPIVWTEVKDSGILLTIRYLCDPRRRRSSAETIWEDILRAFASHDDISFAYQTIRYYEKPTEEKSGFNR